MSREKPLFAPIPPRALRDHELTALDLRVLGAVAMHDRLSMARQGQGCYASLRTIAADLGRREASGIGVHPHSVSTSIGVLVARGYLMREPQKTDRRKHVLRVLYDGSPTGEASDHSGGNDRSHGNEQSGAFSSPGTEANAGRSFGVTGNDVIENPVRSDLNIFSEAVRYPAEAGKNVAKARSARSNEEDLSCDRFSSSGGAP